MSYGRNNDEAYYDRVTHKLARTGCVMGTAIGLCAACGTFLEPEIADDILTVGLHMAGNILGNGVTGTGAGYLIARAYRFLTRLG
ncbi:MAG: hypothetical protein ISS48_01675 [Candidatus Aenigmarchaeota archaeon]|nr:hypothetical protein [Candidatus Aenigmarchaeota archaeon]